MARTQNACSSAIKTLKLKSFFSVPGWASDQELLAYLSTVDVCLAPDPPVRFNQLSTFTKIMEHMNCVKVTVSFDLLESRRAAGDTVVLWARDDPAEFAEAIEQILDDGQRRCEFGICEGIHANRDWGRMAAVRRVKKEIPDHNSDQMSHW